MTTEEDAASADDLLDELWRVFVDPPDDARPRAWWHWMDGNITKDGIKLDLEWLHRVGIGGVTLFDAADAGPVPEAFVAVTVNVYAVPLVNPVTTIGEPAPLAVIDPGLDVTV